MWTMNLLILDNNKNITLIKCYKMYIRHRVGCKQEKNRILMLNMFIQ